MSCKGTDHFWGKPYDVKFRRIDSSFGRFIPELFSFGFIKTKTDKYVVTCKRTCGECKKSYNFKTYVRESAWENGPTQKTLSNAKWELNETFK